MVAEDGSITRLVDQARSQVRQVHVLCRRVSQSLRAMNSAGEESAEGGWRRDAM